MTWRLKLREFFFGPLRASTLMVFTVIAGTWIADAVLSILGIVFPVPVVLLAALALVGTLKVVARPLSSRQLVLCGMWMALLSVWPFTTRKSFVRTVETIRPGMTTAEVDNLLARFPKGHPRMFGPEPLGQQTWHTDGGLTDRFTVVFERDRVAAVELGLD